MFTDNHSFHQARRIGSVRILALICVAVLAPAIPLMHGRTAQAATRTSTQSGPWSSTTTWGGNPAPVCGDDVIIANGHTVTLTSNTGGGGCSLNITINNGGTLDLGGFELSFSGNGNTFTNSGTFANSGAFNRLVSANGGANFTFAGQGIYSGNLKLQNVNTVWQIAANTSFTFNSATNNPNIQIDHPATLNLPNDLNINGPSAGTNYVIFDKATGAGMNGTGSIKTQGNIRIKAPTFIDRPVETVSGAAQGEGQFRVGWTVDTGSSLSLSAPMTVSNVNAGSGLIIQSGASVDLAGNQLNIAFNAPFTNNGTVNNSGAFARIQFMDNGTHSISGTGAYSGNAGIQILNNVTNIPAGTSLTFGAPAENTNIEVDSGANLNFTGPGSLTLSGNVSNAGAISFNEGLTSAFCGMGNKIRIRSSAAGTQRTWTGGGQYVMKDVDARDQAGTSTIAVTGGYGAGNTGANWTFSPCMKSRADFDGDDRTDVSVYRPNAVAPNFAVWYLQRSQIGFFGVQFGIATDIVVPGDYDGDNSTDIAVARLNSNGMDPDFFVINSASNTFSYPVWGNPGDIPVCADYDGDGRADIGVFRPSDGGWYVQLSAGGFILTTHGQNGDKPYPMDTDGDGKAQLAYFRPSMGNWVVRNQTGGGSVTTNFGLAADVPVPADYDGDNKDDIAVFRDGLWIIRRSSDAAVQFVPFGSPGDVPVPGDYDADNRYDPAVYRTGVWHMLRSTAGYTGLGFGSTGDTPIPMAYVP